VKQGIKLQGYNLFTVDRPKYALCSKHLGPGGYPIGSSLLVCPICTETWARLTSEGHPRHRVSEALCEHCDNGEREELFIPGSLMNNLWLPDSCDWDLFDHLPLNLQMREARLALEYLCKSRDIISPSAEGAGQSSTESSRSESPSAISENSLSSSAIL
jgi:hypothetical protein